MNQAFKAIKKPVMIDAIQLTRNNTAAVVKFVTGNFPKQDCNMSREAWQEYIEIVNKSGFKLMTLESDGQTQIANIGD